MTSASQADQIAALKVRLHDFESLPSPPGIVNKILALADDPKSTSQDFAAVVQVDTTLSARLLQLANSPLYGLSRKIHDISHAVTVLGLDATINNAVSIALVASMQQQKSTGVDYRQFWRRSLATAAASRLLNLHIGAPRTERYFMAGLLQDIGIIALAALEPELYAELGARQQDHSAVIAAEQKAFSAEHALAGSWLLESWKLPELYVKAARGSHIPAAVECNEEELLVVHCTAAGAAIADILYDTEQRQAVRRALAIGPDITQLSPLVLLDLVPKLATELQTLGTLFELDVGSAAMLEAAAATATEQIQALVDSARPTDA